MRKIMPVVTMIAVFVSFTALAYAEVGFQFRIPFQVVQKKQLKDVGGQASLLTFDLDAGTNVGILNEHIDFTDNGGAAPAAGTYDFTALRITKSLVDPVYLGLDLGTANCGAVNKNVADVFGGVKLLASKGKINSFLNVELLYRFMKVTVGNVTDFSGVMLNVGAGINF